MTTLIEPGTVHRFGGAWTAEKLHVLRDYLSFYTRALQAQKFQLVYIDSFAGTGRCHIRVDAHSKATIDGSAKIALDCAPAFDRYHFIESKKSHAAELTELISAHPSGARAQVHEQNAHAQLPKILAQYNWRGTRGVLFLDPYGLQCTWNLLEQVAATKALDVFFLVSLSGLFRQAAVDEKRIDEGKAAALTAFLGTDDWRNALYTREQQDLFGSPAVTRDKGYQGILDFTTARLKSLFAHVSEPYLLKQTNGAPLFALYFAVSNPSRPAKDLASRVSREILSKLR